ncbi:hypothetical protein B0H11DRAFT_1975816 [Mycena galericulata]|nr:hypothetical protein B0H11DRAFT_1975816 [Mycena galericulata]
MSARFHTGSARRFRPIASAQPAARCSREPSGASHVQPALGSYFPAPGRCAPLAPLRASTMDPREAARYMQIQMYAPRIHPARRRNHRPKSCPGHASACTHPLALLPPYSPAARPAQEHPHPVPFRRHHTTPTLVMLASADGRGRRECAACSTNAASMSPVLNTSGVDRASAGQSLLVPGGKSRSCTCVPHAHRAILRGPGAVFCAIRKPATQHVSIARSRPCPGPARRPRACAACVPRLPGVGRCTCSSATSMAHGAYQRHAFIHTHLLLIIALCRYFHPSNGKSDMT